MKIVRLQVENVKRIVAVDISPKGPLVVIGGDNEQGKSSILDSIEMAFGGKAVQPKRPIRKGQEKGTIVAETEDFVLTRVMREDGKDVLTIRSREGGRYGQTTADGWVTSLTFDPLEFTRMDAAVQLRTLKRLVGVDFSKLDDAKAKLYDRRKSVNAEGVRLKGQFEGTKHHDGVPDELVSVSDLMGTLEEFKAVNRANESVRLHLTECRGSKEVAFKKVTDTQASIRVLEERLRKERIEFQQWVDRESEFEERVRNLEDKDENSIAIRIRESEGINGRIRENRKRAALEESLNAERAKSKALTEEIEAIEVAKREMLAAAKFPVAGLSLAESGIEYHGIPFDQCSDAQKLRVSTAMGFALNPKLKVILIRNGSLLDSKNLLLMSEIAEENDGQIWIERVGKGDANAIVIEEGSVVATAD